MGRLFFIILGTNRHGLLLGSLFEKYNPRNETQPPGQQAAMPEGVRLVDLRVRMASDKFVDIFILGMGAEVKCWTTLLK